MGITCFYVDIVYFYLILACLKALINLFIKFDGFWITLTVQFVLLISEYQLTDQLHIVHMIFIGLLTVNPLNIARFGVVAKHHS